MASIEIELALITFIVHNYLYKKARREIDFSLIYRFSEVL